MISTAETAWTEFSKGEKYRSSIAKKRKMAPIKESVMNLERAVRIDLSILSYKLSYRYEANMNLNSDNLTK